MALLEHVDQSCKGYHAFLSALRDELTREDNESVTLDTPNAKKAILDLVIWELWDKFGEDHSLKEAPSEGSFGFEAYKAGLDRGSQGGFGYSDQEAEEHYVLWLARGEDKHEQPKEG